MNDVNIEKKRFEAFTHTARELINVAFMFHIADGIAKSRVTKFYYSAEMTDGILTGNDFIMRCMQIFSLIYDEKAMIKRDMMYINVY